ncbi:MAG: tetratricopeptide repeat protein [Pseudomonadota bacterium]
MQAKQLLGTLALLIGATWFPSAVGQTAVPEEAWCVESVANATICREIGVEFMVGDRVARDSELATTLLIAACTGGDAQGCLSAAYEFYDRSRYDPDGELGRADRERARELALAACDGGLGRGCDFATRFYIPDFARITTLYVAACDHGHVYGCLQAGNNYATGYSVPQDHRRAIALYTTACLNDRPDGCFEAGRLYLAGTDVPEDRILAEALYAETCERVATAQEEEGLRFITRWGVDVAIPLVRACEAGFDQAYANAAD